MKRLMAAVVLAATAGVCSAATECVSAPTAVCVRPERSCLFATAPGSTFTLQWEKPGPLAVATLTVTNEQGFNRVWNGLESTSLEVSLPEPTESQEERIYDFELAFNDGSVKRTSLAVVRGSGTDESDVSIRAAPPGVRWLRFDKYALLRLPYGHAAFSVAGKPIETDGSEQWRMLGPVAWGETLAVALSGDGCEGEWALNSRNSHPGLVLFVK